MLDMVLAVFILTMIMLLYFSYYTNEAPGNKSDYQNLVSEAKTISDYLVGTGYPRDWNESNVVRIGLTDNYNILDLSKLSRFSDLTKNDYGKTRDLLKTRYDYIVFFQDYEKNLLNLTGDRFLGKPGINNTNIESLQPSQLSRISRFVVEKQGQANITARIIEMVIYVWDER